MRTSVFAILGCALLAAAGLEAAGVSSGEAVVYLRPERSSFWRTLEATSFAVPIVYPPGATEAKLTIKGRGYSWSRAGITADTQDVTLPEVATQETEDVYTFRLEFDTGDVSEITLGNIYGCRTAGEGRTRLLNPYSADSTRWCSLAGRAVLPVPYGAKTLTVDDVAVDTGLDGAQGWMTYGPLTYGEKHDLVLITEEKSFYATILGKRVGSRVVFR